MDINKLGNTLSNSDIVQILQETKTQVSLENKVSCPPLCTKCIAKFKRKISSTTQEMAERNANKENSSDTLENILNLVEEMRMKVNEVENFLDKKHLEDGISKFSKIVDDVLTQKNNSSSTRESIQNLLKMSIEDLVENASCIPRKGSGTIIVNALFHTFEIRRIEEILEFTGTELRKGRMLGAKSLRLLRECLAEKGLRSKRDHPGYKLDL